MLGEHRHGTLAEFVVVPERNLAPVPAEMPITQAAAFSLVTLTAWRMLVHRAALRPGETVLIWGIGGGVAVAALKIAKLLGASVVVTSSSDAKLERARELGADVVLNHAKTDVPKEIRSLTSKRGVEVVVDNVGEQTWEKSLRCLARKGTPRHLRRHHRSDVRDRRAEAVLVSVEHSGFDNGEPRGVPRSSRTGRAGPLVA